MARAHQLEHEAAGTLEQVDEWREQDAFALVVRTRGFDHVAERLLWRTEVDNAGARTRQTSGSLHSLRTQAPHEVLVDVGDGGARVVEGTGEVKKETRRANHAHHKQVHKVDAALVTIVSATLCVVVVVALVHVEKGGDHDEHERGKRRERHQSDHQILDGRQRALAPGR